MKILLLLTMMLTGCAQFQPVRDKLVTEGSAVTDQILADAKFITCQATTIGALERDLGADQERIEGWILWCGKKSQNTPLTKELK